MFVHTIDPVLITIGPLSIRYYGLIYAFGFVLAYIMLRHYAKKGTLRMPVERLDTYILFLVVGVVIGSRLFEVLFWEPAYYFSNPAKSIAIWEGGLSYHGGLAAAALVSFWFCRRYRLSFMNIADHLVIPASLALGLGRIANFINAELWGTVTDVPWCVVFPAVEGCRHPVQLYNAGMWFAIAAVLIVLRKRYYPAQGQPAAAPAGLIFWWFMLLNGLGRLVLDVWREDTRLFGLSTGQYFSIVLVVLGAYVLSRYYQKRKKERRKERT